MADRTIDIDEVDKAFYVHYGRAMANWAQLENSLAGIFQRITRMPGKLSGEVFYSARSFQGRADMLAACVPLARTVPDGKAFLIGSIRRARAYAVFRNRLAHNMHTLDMGDGEWSAATASRRIISGVAGPDYDASLVENAATNFGRLGILNLVSLGRGKLLREPGLSLSLLDLLPSDAEHPQTDPSAVATRISELASL